MTSAKTKKFATQRQSATNRLSLRTIATTSEMFTSFAGVVAKKVADSAGDDGYFDAIELGRVKAWFYAELDALFGRFDALVKRATEQGALIGLATLGHEHQRMFLGKEAVALSQETDQIEDDMRRWSKEFLDSAASRMSGSGSNRVNYSQRLWNLQAASRANFDSVMLNALTDGVGAWETAKLIERFLSAGAECPQWLYTRLYPAPGTIPKGERPTRTRDGLISGSPCSNKTGEPSVAYAALRLARTEIAWVAGQATYQSQRIAPFVTGANNILSNTHPKRDICDDVTANNPHQIGQPMTPSTHLHPPHHPNCLCTSVSETPPLSEVTASVKSWVNGGSNPALDKYANELGFFPQQLSNNVTNKLISDTLFEAMRAWLSIDSTLHTKLLGI